ncbi:hypothetical protein BH20PSE1_BH20PSE1_23030 [soil metagenome]
MANHEVETFLTHLAEKCRPLHQAMSAILFLHA